MKRSMLNFQFLPSARPAPPRPVISRATQEPRGPVKSMLCGAALVSFMAAAATAHAAQFSVSGNIAFQDPGLVVIDQYDLNAVPISVGREVHHEVLGERDFHAQASSLAESHGLHAHTFTQVIHQVSGGIPPGTDGGTYSATAFAQSSFGDFVVTGPLGATTVQAAINFHMSGEQAVSSFIPPAGHGGGGSQSSVVFSMSLGSGGSDGGHHTFSNQRGILSTFEGGMLAGFNGNMDVKTMVFTLPVNTPISMALFMTVSSSVSLDFADSFNVSSNTDFNGTLTFATDKPVFDLPAGYTVNSAEAGVLGNVFVAPLAVPEPATAWMVGVGLAGLWLWRRRAVAMVSPAQAHR